MFPKSFTYIINLALAALIITSCGGEQVAYQPTPTRVIPTPTSTPIPTLTPQPTATLVPTREPNDPISPDLQKYKVVSTQTRGPDGYIYSVYLLNGPSLEETQLASDFSRCNLYFYRWDGFQQKLIALINHKSGISSFDCQFTNWDTRNFDIKEHKALGLAGYWSDINNNGKPEIMVEHFSGCGGCNVANTYVRAFYEIQGTDTVVDIANGLYGYDYQIVPFPGMIFHSENPLSIYVHQYHFYDFHSYIRIGWVYQWDGSKFVNVSDQYVDEYRLQVKQLVEKIKKQYGTSLPSIHRDFGYNGADPVVDMLEIVLIANTVKLPAKEISDFLLEASDISHWTGTDKWTLCRMQMFKAYVQISYERGEPFRTGSPLIDHRGFGKGETMMDRVPEEIKTANRFDISACK